MRVVLITFLICIFITGCSRVGPEYDNHKMQINETITSVNKTISIRIPTSHPKVIWMGWSDFRQDRITLDRTIPNMMIEDIDMEIRYLDPQYLRNYGLLHKETNDKEEEYLENEPLTDWEIKNHKERKVEFFKRYVDFIVGLKCATTVESQSMIADGIGSKYYQTSCNYYDKQGLPKLLYVRYRYYFTFDSTKFEGSNDPSLVKHKLEEIQLQFKMDMKEIFDSIEIYDMDIERMRKEGLLYDRKYEIQRW